MPRSEFRVSVTKDYLVFASAHFITFAGHRCEGLHGHNYRARVTVEGALNKESWFVFDFVELKRIMKRLCDEIDHLVLLPLKSDRVRVVEEGESVSVSVDGKPRYVFPRKDCALLPIPNTTVEMLAQLLTERLQQRAADDGRTGPDGDRDGSGRELRAIGCLSGDPDVGRRPLKEIYAPRDRLPAVLLRAPASVDWPPRSRPRHQVLPSTSSAARVVTTAALPRMPSRQALGAMSPEHIESELASFSMRRQGASLSPAERRAVAEFLTGRPAGSYRAPIAIIPKSAYCTAAATTGDPLNGASWNGWGIDLQNTRHQTGGGCRAHRD